MADEEHKIDGDDQLTLRDRVTPSIESVLGKGWLYCDLSHRPIIYGGDCKCPICELRER